MPNVSYSIRPEYIKITGSLDAALMLAQIIFWFTPGNNGTKLRVKWNGELWLVKSWRHWAQEIGLSRKRSYLAQSKLKALQLIATEVHKYNNVPTTYIKLNLDRLEYELEKASKIIGCSLGSINLLSEEQPGCSQGSNVNITETTKTEITNIELPAATTEKLEILLQPIEGKDLATLNEILKAKKDQINGINLGNKPKHLAIRWKKGLSKIYGGFIKDLTMEDIGKLKMLSEKCGEDVAKVIDFTLPRWGEFTFEVKAKYGVAIVPERPVVGFLLKYHDVAIQGLQTPIKATSIPAPHVVAQKSIDNSSKEIKHDIVSKEVVAAALAKIKKG